MKRMIQKALRLPLRRKTLFARVSLHLLLVHAALRLFSFSTVYSFLKRFHHAPTRADHTNAAHAEICWAVNRAGRFWFADHGCLTQALVGETLLIRSGIPARLLIGVRKQAGEGMLAHAWVESSGQIVIGGKTRLNIQEFQNFPEIQQVIG